VTCAARPTFDPAKGGKTQGGGRTHAPSAQVSARALPSHTTLKLRRNGQGTKSEITHRDLKTELIERERVHLLKIGKLTKNEIKKIKASSEKGKAMEIINDDKEEEYENDDEEEKRRKKKREWKRKRY